MHWIFCLSVVGTYKKQNHSSFASSLVLLNQKIPTITRTYAWYTIKDFVLICRDHRGSEQHTGSNNWAFSILFQESTSSSTSVTAMKMLSQSSVIQFISKKLMFNRSNILYLEILSWNVHNFDQGSLITKHTTTGWLEVTAYSKMMPPLWKLKGSFTLHDFLAIQDQRNWVWWGM